MLYLKIRRIVTCNMSVKLVELYNRMKKLREIDDFLIDISNTLIILLVVVLFSLLNIFL